MITILDIQTAIAERFGLRIADLRGPRKIPSYAGPRMLAMYLARLLTGASCTRSWHLGGPRLVR